MVILLQEKSARMNIFKQIKRIVHGDFSVCSLNTKSFYHDLIKISQSEFCCRGKGKTFLQKHRILFGLSRGVIRISHFRCFS